MKNVLIAIALVLAACTSPTLTHCPDIDCPKDKVCDGQGGCAFPAQVSACNGFTTGDPCNYPDPTGATVTGECVNMVCLPLGCGNGVATPDEACDDGNNVSGDGCSADCSSNETCGNSIIDTAVGEECDLGAQNADGSDCESNCRLPRCGNGVVDPKLHEQCDDGPNNSDAAGARCRTTCQLARCGDNIVDTALGEVCDDGNNVSGDGCSSDCKSNETCGNNYVDIEFGEQCDQGSANSNMPDAPCRADCKFQRCGDGILDVMHGEACDQGAANSNTPDACRTNCQNPRCGDGIRDTGEACDDGNNVSGDGCSGDCQSLETCGNGIIDLANGEQCDNGASNSNTPNQACRTNCQRQQCGDAVIDNLFGEICDLGNANSNNPNATCRTNCLPQRCGDGVVDNTKGEVCDDGNTVSGDGCSNDCRSNETCGNSVIDAVKGEQCDAGAMNANTPNAPCRTSCQLPKCGDSIVDNTLLGELCDLGAMNSNNPNATCRTNCLPQRCGDGIIDNTKGEVCDDGNTTSGDGCSADCKSAETCGNGIVDTAKGEQCDAGAMNSNNPNAPCRTNCQLPKCGDNVIDNMLGETCDLGASNSNAPNATCRTNCQPQRCGDTIVDNTKGEVCDDGNNTAGDGCSSDCKSNETCGNGIVDIAKGEQCDDGGLNSNNPNATCRTTCLRQKCGDSIVDTTFGEACDLGASNSNAANATCRTNCQPQRCGDGIVDNTKGEVCDDGNNTSGDGCSASCNSNETCGNSIVDTAKGEQCDAGGANANTPNAPCRTTCLLPKCGDGIVDTARGEVCDAGAANSNNPNAPCRLTCVPPKCGDGIVDNTLGEVCDDGNTVNGDGCSSDCKSNETCGNGVIDYVKNESCDDGNTRPYDGCSACQPETEVVLSPGGAPPARDSELLVYDGAREKVVMFGGRGTGATVLGDTWEWDGSSWTQMHPVHSPSGRFDAAAAYDAVRHRVVMFGGTTLGTGANTNDTWEWDGVDWKLYAPATSPSGRTGAAASFDAARGHVILFGGTDGTVANQETWEWTGVTWSPLSPATKPGARYGARMAYDSTNHYTLLYGGSTGDTHAWTFDGVAVNWTDKGSTVGPSTAIDGNVLAFDANLGALVAWGGVASATYTWTGTLWSSNASATPSARTNITGTYDAIRTQVVVFGGNASGTQLADTWLRKGAVWTQATALSLPSTRMRAAAGYDPLRRRVVVFGGQNQGRRFYGCTNSSCMMNDTYEWDGHAWKTIAPATKPATRAGSWLDYDTTAKVMRLYGGDSYDPGPPVKDNNYTDIWNYDGTNWASQTSTGRQQVQTAAMAYDANKNNIVTFGGSFEATNCCASVNTTWTWDSVNHWRQLTPAGPPPPRGNPQMAYDKVRKKTVLFSGGPRDGTTLDDTWEFDGTVWTRVANNVGPYPRFNARMFYNPDSANVTLFGSSDLPTGEDVWEWNGTTWTQRPQLGSFLSHYAPAVAYDAANHQIVSFSGRNNDLSVFGPTADFGIFKSMPNQTAEACTFSSVDYDNDGKAGCADDECWAQCNPLCPPALNAAGLCPAGAPKCGDGVCSPFEDCDICPADCTTGCPAQKCGDFRCNGTETHATCPNDC